ncbi:hypothetical protein DICVIV_07851 [Dictyocaulus viviparus]|uniref:Uncharacterized protein n=1 Tax=Dictyocaulus viviparus TaxID=29172 RepID=A0A0D8XUM0_DICVI|nr:hypothetical protein DICVIV_07851 [Dictyocaulus viviparus]
MEFMLHFMCFRILAVRLFDGYWLYPILELLGLEHLAMFFPVLVIGYYFLIRLSTIIPLLLSGYSQASSKSQHKYKKFQ